MQNPLRESLLGGLRAKPGSLWGSCESDISDPRQFAPPKRALYRIRGVTQGVARPFAPEIRPFFEKRGSCLSRREVRGGFWRRGIWFCFLRLGRRQKQKQIPLALFFKWGNPIVAGFAA
ncbi:MAG: hypothetical protein ACREP7_18355 [Lysobacter sp.]